MADVNINFFIVQNIFCVLFLFVFFLFKAHIIYYCEVLLISVKPIVNNKDIDDYCLFALFKICLEAVVFSELVLDHYLALI